MTDEIVLHVYDLSLGAVAKLSESFLGVQVDGFWHTSLVVYGYEYFYGKTIHRKRPKDFEKMFGHPPVMKIPLGDTQFTKRAFETHITSKPFQDKYNQDQYDILKNNCNDFCRDAIAFALPEVQLTEEVEEIFDNASLVASSPRVQTFLGLFFTGKKLGLNFMSKLMEKTNLSTDKEAIKNVLKIFSKPSALERGSDEEIDLDQDDEEEDNEMDISPEAAIGGILDFFESLSSKQKMKLPVHKEEEENKRKTRLPPGTKAAAINFGKNLVEAIKLINTSIANAVDKEAFEEEANMKKKKKKTIDPKKTLFDEVDEQEIVPLTAEVIEFLNNTFDSTYEAIVVRTVRGILEKNGYYEMNALRGTSEEEFIQMGVKKGWAKKLKTALDNYFM